MQLIIHQFLCHLMVSGQQFVTFAAVSGFWAADGHPPGIIFQVLMPSLNLLNHSKIHKVHSFTSTNNCNHLTHFCNCSPPTFGIILDVYCAAPQQQTKTQLMCGAPTDKLSELVTGSHNRKQQKLAAIGVCTKPYLQESIHSAITITQSVLETTL